MSGVERELARIGGLARRVGVHLLLAAPGLEATQLGDGLRRRHPLQGLRHGGVVHVIQGPVVGPKC